MIRSVRRSFRFLLTCEEGLAPKRSSRGQWARSVTWLGRDVVVDTLHADRRLGRAWVSWRGGGALEACELRMRTITAFLGSIFLRAFMSDSAKIARRIGPGASLIRGRGL
jgi:hypothetical protein